MLRRREHVSRGVFDTWRHSELTNAVRMSGVRLNAKLRPIQRIRANTDGAVLASLRRQSGESERTPTAPSLHHSVGNPELAIIATAGRTPLKRIQEPPVVATSSPRLRPRAASSRHVGEPIRPMIEATLERNVIVKSTGRRSPTSNRTSNRAWARNDRHRNSSIRLLDRTLEFSSDPSRYSAFRSRYSSHASSYGCPKTL
jgi:hypothetical protein